MKRERKRKLSTRDLRALGANPDRVRRMIPPDGRQRVEVRGTRSPLFGRRLTRYDELTGQDERGTMRAPSGRRADVGGEGP